MWSKGADWLEIEGRGWRHGMTKVVVDRTLYP